MKRFVVSLDLLSETSTLVDLRMLLGEEGSVDSFDRDDGPAPTGARRYSLLRIPSSEPDSESANAHVVSLRPTIERIASRLKESARDDVKALLNVAVFFDTANASIDLSASLLTDLVIPIDISVSIYPVSAECSSDVDGE